MNILHMMNQLPNLFLCGHGTRIGAKLEVTDLKDGFCIY